MKAYATACQPGEPAVAPTGIPTASRPRPRKTRFQATLRGHASSSRLAKLPGLSSTEYGGAVCVFRRPVGGLALVGQAKGVALGGSHQPSVDQVIDRSVNVVKVVTQKAREGGRVELTLRVR
jgi:hypothetical protein